MTPFVGRVHELEALRSGIDRLTEGRGGLWLLRGPAGIGKTRLADELAHRAHGRGVTALWARCWEADGAPAFWPCAQLIRACVTGAPTLRPTLAPEIANLVPELEPAGRIPPAAETDPATARFHLFDVMAAFWSQAAAARPLLLIIDDLHWADTPSLRLLLFLVTALRADPIMWLATYRDAEAHDDAARRGLFVDIARAGESLTLPGLSQPEVVSFLTGALTREPPRELVRVIAERSEGNPFFINELLQLSAAGLEWSGTAPPPVPHGIRHVLEQRLDRLSPGCRAVLRVAAVIGRSFELTTLAAAAGLDGIDRIAPAIDEARAASIIAPDGGARRYRFAHALIRDTLYEHTPAGERMRVHHTIGELLAATAAVEPRIAEIAHHYLAAGPELAGARATTYATQAGDRAARLLAFEEAVRFYQLALDHHAALSQPDSAAGERLALLLSLGDAQLRAGERPAARATYQRAAELARVQEDRRALARAALGFSGLGDATATTDTAAVALLEEALTALGAEPSSARVQVMSRLAELLYFATGSARRIDDLSRAAVAGAEALGDAGTLGYALIARHYALWRADTLPQRIQIADRILDVARGEAHKELALYGHFWRLIDMLEVGDMPAVDAALARFSALAMELRQAFHQWQAESMRAMRATLLGQFAAAEELVQSALALGRQAQSPMATFRYGVQIALLRREQGRLDEVEPFTRMMVERYPHLAVARSWLAMICVTHGRHEEARTLFEQLAENEFASLPRDATWLSTLGQLALVCAELGDVTRAATLYAQLLPYAERNIVVSFAHGCDGAVARPLALLAATLSREDDAARHFEAALDVHRRLGARPFLAHTLREYGVMLRARGGPGDVARARQLLGAAADLYAELGMEAWLPRTRAALDACEAPPPDTAAPAAQEHAFLRQGDLWVIAYAGKTVRLRDTKGLHYLAHLLRHPGRDWHVLDLTSLLHGSGAAGEAAGNALRRQCSTPGGPDARAKAAYGERLTALRDEIADAERCNDLTRAAAAHREVDLLGAELGRAYRLGAAREHSEPLEKARKAVSNRLRAALARLSREHPALGRHLTLTLRLGTYCSYRPEQPPDWRLD